jgi:two-component system, cell cycle sensor histidine kinase and response regulator CckA
MKFFDGESEIETASRSSSLGTKNRNEMKTPLYILHFEDDQDDATLVRSHLEAQGITCNISRVQTRADFLSALERGGIDLILSDFSLPSFDGLSAAKLVRSSWPNIPLILVSGSLHEDLIIDWFKSGGTDCISKKHLSRLPQAVRRAMQEVEERSARHHLEAQVSEAQKMLSRLSSGVAHDFNNILAVIVGYNDLLTSELGSENPLQKYTEEIRHASNRGGGLTRQLLVFNRKQLVQPVLIDLNDLVKDLGKLRRRLIDEKIELTLIPAKETGRVMADSGYIGQLLLNLVLNARDAMPDGGKITIDTKDVTLDRDHSQTRDGTNPSDYVMVSISDTGVGMTEEVKAHLFEPFFTTKPYATGLGLATCRTIVEQCGGHIDVSSEIGEGATIKMYFPRAGRSLDVASIQIERDQSRRGTDPSLGAENGFARSNDSAPRILVVEDEISIRQLTTAILMRSGYEVDSATDGAAGWRALQAKQYDLVITDNFMPKLTGVEMVKKLQAARMQLPVIVATGLFPQEEFIAHPWLGSVTVLVKPFQAAELLSAVSKALRVSDGDH